MSSHQPVSVKFVIFDSHQSIDHISRDVPHELRRHDIEEQWEYIFGSEAKARQRCRRLRRLKYFLIVTITGAVVFVTIFLLSLFVIASPTTRLLLLFVPMVVLPAALRIGCMSRTISTLDAPDMRVFEGRCNEVNSRIGCTVDFEFGSDEIVQRVYLNTNTNEQLRRMIDGIPLNARQQMQLSKRYVYWLKLTRSPPAPTSGEPPVLRLVQPSAPTIQVINEESSANIRSHVNATSATTVGQLHQQPQPPSYTDVCTDILAEHDVVVEEPPGYDEVVDLMFILNGDLSQIAT